MSAAADAPVLRRSLQVEKNIAADPAAKMNANFAIDQKIDFGRSMLLIVSFCPRRGSLSRAGLGRSSRWTRKRLIAVPISAGYLFCGSP